ncbi:L-serine ammonia-lyase, iron-sulfur-dependent, subunit alpha [Clostridium swellfunianum]|uniref:L-cysteine desulfidase family protein n=1 Tax=Clostridium swellfunianum TaxID=1367462 RepID=UPI00202F627F|nr:L-serine ammonia-lyase, iron-sulfur-dependent, subunit alpha [Clostridium swellfunianum]MCM0649154.1 L-serine ammonia-lyase, iron-sulfur-dependent, subunit alpha [Clostridium swellfunianum]
MDENVFLRALDKELVVALGCTEPIAIALAAATARKYSGDGEVLDLKVYASSNVIKNAMAVNIPGTGSCGINLAAALGALADADKSLEVLSGLNKKDIDVARDMIRGGVISVDTANTSKKLYIEVVIKTDKSTSRVIIEDRHTNVTVIEVDGVAVKDSRVEEVSEDSSDFTMLNIDNIWNFIETVNVDKLGLVKQSIELNKAAGEEGLRNPYGLQVGKTIIEEIKKGIIADDLMNYAMALTAAGSDARMAGCTLSVMSNSGSGNQGITATLPVVAVGEKLKETEEKLLRAVTLSHLITIYIKSKFGRLSALCGATIAATGASCGVVYILGGNKSAVRAAIQNMLGNITGMLCDGAKIGCALKVSTCTNAAIQSAFLANRGIAISATDGIIEEDAEDTIDNLCRLGNQGTPEIDKIILEIMLNK